MPAKRYRTRANTAALDRTEQDAAQRSLCTALRFWKFCGNRSCRRAKACASEAAACFAQLWPLVPPETKAMVRVALKSSAAGRAPHELAADLERERLRHDTIAPPATDSATPPSPADGSATAAPSKARLRVL